MLKKTITYTNDFTGKEMSEEHYFHISKADLIRMDMEDHGKTFTDPNTGEHLTGLRAHLAQVVAAEDGKGVMEAFEGLIRRSYGKKVGDNFVKNAAVWDEFSSSAAYDALFFEICTNADEAAKFMNGIIPAELSAEVAQIKQTTQEQAQAEHEAKADPTGLSVATTPQVLTAQQIADMPADELKSGLSSGRYKLS